MKTESVSEARQNQASAGSISASVVVPITEVESLPDLISAIATTLTASQVSYEIICVMMAPPTAQLNNKLSNSTDLKAVLLRRNMVKLLQWQLGLTMHGARLLSR